MPVCQRTHPSRGEQPLSRLTAHVQQSRTSQALLKEQKALNFILDGKGVSETFYRPYQISKSQMKADRLVRRDDDGDDDLDGLSSVPNSVPSQTSTTISVSAQPSPPPPFTLTQTFTPATTDPIPSLSISTRPPAADVITTNLGSASRSSTSSATSTPSLSAQRQGSDGGLAGGAIAGIVLSIIAVILLAFGFLMWRRRSRKRKRGNSSTRDTNCTDMYAGSNYGKADPNRSPSTHTSEELDSKQVGRESELDAGSTTVSSPEMCAESRLSVPRYDHSEVSSPKRKPVARQSPLPQSPVELA